MQERIKKEILNIICKPQFDDVMIMPGAVDDAVQAIMAVFEESLPEKVDMASKYEGNEGVHVSIDDNEDITGDNLAHLAQFASNQGYNQAIEEMEGKLK